MPGTETQNYDLVMEFSEQAYRDLLGAIFDSNGFLCSILDGIGTGELCGAFTVDVLFDRPTDVALPATATDLLDIRVNLGDTGSLGRLRMVVGVDVDHTAADLDLVRINFHDRLFFTEATIFGIPSIPGVPGPTELLENLLRNQIQLIPLLPVRVNRSSTDPKTVTAADVRIIDDTAAADLDASAALLTFGGGTAGNRAGFTRSFIPPGGTGGIAVFFNWLCRIISPAIEQALDLPAGGFTNCRLSQTVRIDEEENVDLTRLELTLDEGFIRVLAQVEKSGTCYTAKGTVAGRIEIRIDDGQLIVNSLMEDPDIDLDIPWYCWVAAVVLGLVLGGALFGAIGALVGGILIPLIAWIGLEAIEGVLEDAAALVAEKINSVAPSVDTPAIGINLIFQEVFIDDILIKGKLECADNAPIRSEGTLVVRNGERVDLDNGRVGGPELAGADLSWDGKRFTRRLTTLCSSALARTGSREFENVTRHELYGFPYASPEAIAFLELATIDLFGPFTGDFFRETRRVFAARTDEGRYAALRVVEVEDDFVRLQYRTFEKQIPTVDIKGDFVCERPPRPPKDAVVTFEPVRTAPSRGSSSGKEDVANTLHGLCASLARASLATIPAEIAEGVILTKTPPRDLRIGGWFSEYTFAGSEVGRFDAITNGLRHPVTFEWSIEGEALVTSEGDRIVDGVTFHYKVDGGRLLLRTSGTQAVEFEIGVEATDAKGIVLSTNRCVRYSPQCKRKDRFFPPWATFVAAYGEHYGVVEVPVKSGEKTDLGRARS